MKRNREIGVVIDGRIRTCYLCFTYISVSTVSFVLVKANYKSMSEVPKFRVNSLSIVYCVTYNLSIFIISASKTSRETYRYLEFKNRDQPCGPNIGKEGMYRLNWCYRHPSSRNPATDNIYPIVAQKILEGV